MSLKANHFAQHATTVGGFPTTGGTSGPNKTKTSTTVRKKKSLTAEEKADKLRADDPYGDHGGAGRTQRGGGQTRVVRRKVRRRRVSAGETKPNYGTSKTDQAKQAKQQTKAQQSGQTQGSSPNKSMMKSMNAQSSLNMMTANFQNAQASRPNGPQTPVGKKMAMLGHLQDYMKNDYAAMKANDQDTAFTYRTSEARQLCATLGTMVASATKQGTSKKDTKGSNNESGLTAPAFARQKGLLKRLKAMSDPSGPLPDGLPIDYKPFEDVA